MTTPIEIEFLGYFPSPAGSGSTARQVRSDMSSETARASGGYSAWDGVQEVLMPECDCACGGQLVADSKADRDMLLAVQTHNASLQHLAWRQRRVGQ